MPDCGRNCRGKGVEVCLIRDHAREGRWNILSTECELPGEHFVEQTAEGPDIGALIDRLPLCLLRTHVSGSPENDAHLRGRGRQHR